MTDTNQELDELLDRLMQYSYDYGSRKILISEDPPLIIARQTKQAILDWHSKQVLEIIGDDQSQKRPEGGKNTAEWTNGRNNLRQQQRNKLRGKQSYDQL